MRELWCIHVLGPDTVIPQPDRATAMQRAHEWNAMFLERMARDPHPHDPLVWAVPEIWLHNDQSHAEALAEHGGEPEDIC